MGHASNWNADAPAFYKNWATDDENYQNKEEANVIRNVENVVARQLNALSGKMFLEGTRNDHRKIDYPTAGSTTTLMGGEDDDK